MHKIVPHKEVKATYTNSFVLNIEGDWNDADYKNSEVVLSKEEFEKYLPFIIEALKPEWKSNLDSGRLSFIADKKYIKLSDKEKAYYKEEAGAYGFRDHLSFEEYLAKTMNEEEAEEISEFICSEIVPYGYGCSCHSIELISCHYYDNNSVLYDVEINNK